MQKGTETTASDSNDISQETTSMTTEEIAGIPGVKKVSLPFSFNLDSATTLGLQATFKEHYGIPIFDYNQTNCLDYMAVRDFLNDKLMMILRTEVVDAGCKEALIKSLILRELSNGPGRLEIEESIVGDYDGVQALLEEILGDPVSEEFRSKNCISEEIHSLLLFVDDIAINCGFYPDVHFWQFGFCMARLVGELRNLGEAYGKKYRLPENAFTILASTISEIGEAISDSCNELLVKIDSEKEKRKSFKQTMIAFQSSEEQLELVKQIALLEVNFHNVITIAFRDKNFEEMARNGEYRTQINRIFNHYFMIHLNLSAVFHVTGSNAMFMSMFSLSYYFPRTFDRKTCQETDEFKFDTFLYDICVNTLMIHFCEMSIPVLDQALGSLNEQSLRYYNDKFSKYYDYSHYFFMIISPRESEIDQHLDGFIECQIFWYVKSYKTRFLEKAPESRDPKFLLGWQIFLNSITATTNDLVKSGTKKKEILESIDEGYNTIKRAVKEILGQMDNNGHMPSSKAFKTFLGLVTLIVVIVITFWKCPKLRELF